MLLNCSYVMEFFLQTLVKKKKFSQMTMLNLQKVLMAAATLATVPVLLEVSLPVTLISLILNFVNRKHDFLNTLFIMCIACVLF